MESDAEVHAETETEIEVEIEVEQDAVWKALSDPTRRRMLDLLRSGPLTTGSLVEACREMTRFGVMKHLGVLEASGLVVVRREGRRRWNHLNAVPLRQVYERWVGRFEDRWARTLLDIKGRAESVGEDGRIGGGMTCSIERTIELDASVPSTFEALTKAFGIWCPSMREGGSHPTLDPVPGGMLIERWGPPGGDGAPGTADEHAGQVLGHVQMIERPHRLILRGPMGAPDATTTTVRFDLSPSSKGTEVSISVHGLGWIDDEWRTAWCARASEMLGALRTYMER